MDRIVVVGSGASGVHFAGTLLEKGRRVLMVDVGHRKPPAVNPGDDLNGLKRNLPDPAAYFLGPQYESLILPDFNAEYYGFPPHKKYIFAHPDGFRYQASGFQPLFSFAEGGLAEAWTGGSYPFTKEEIRAFPFSFAELRHYYGVVAKRIGISGVSDDLAPFFPPHDGLMEPLDLDEHSRLLLSSYAKQRESLNRRRCYLGRSRVAALSRDLGERKRCSYSGRCLWGCPQGSLYTPSLTLAQCRAHPAFEYLSGCYASHFRFDTGGRIRTLVVRRGDTGAMEEIGAGTLVLAAGALSSAQILLESIRRDSGEIRKLTGLMDNRQVLMPFVNLKMIGRPFEPKSYQYHQLAIGIAPPENDPLGYVHGLVTTLKTALIHPVVQTLPLDLGGAVTLFRNLHAALGLVNINFSDSRREENYVTLEPDKAGGESRLVIAYGPPESEREKLAAGCSIFRQMLWKLGCIAPPGMTHQRPMGASVHYAGVIPMSREAGSMKCSPLGQSYDFENLYFADGISFPELPAKNLTFTLMANATRIADQAF
jgi:choline dehydrogenase-like flavoprotein